VPVVVLLGMAVTASSAVLRGAAQDQVLEAVLVLAWISAGMAVTSVGAGAMWPNFEADDPRRAVRFESTVIGLASQFAFGVLSAGALTLLLVAEHQRAVFALPLAAFALVATAMAAVVAGGVLVLGARSLDRWSAG